MQTEFGVNVFDGNEDNYLVMRITKSPNEFIDGGDIFDGDNTFPGWALSSDNYDDEIRYILISPVKRKWPTL